MSMTSFSVGSFFVASQTRCQEHRFLWEMFSALQAATVGSATNFAELSSMAAVGTKALIVEVGQLARTTTQMESKGGGRATA